MSSDLLASLEKDGFVVIRSLVPTSSLGELLAAAESTTALARSGMWPYIRTVGKQFPPWPSAPGEAGIWGVQHLLPPELPARAVFQGSYFSEGTLGAARALLGGCGDDELVMELFNMLVRPDGPFELRWHRDDIPPDIEPADEAARLAQPAWHAQWNLALAPDASLVVVPGSHRRARTSVERTAGPYDALPGQITVRLAPGDAVFYDNNVLHRGVYDPAAERFTLHGSVGHIKGSRTRARNVLQHGVGEWVHRCDFGALGEARERAEGMRERLVRMGKESGSVGYSLED